MKVLVIIPFILSLISCSTCRVLNSKKIKEKVVLKEKGTYFELDKKFIKSNCMKFRYTIENEKIRHINELLNIKNGYIDLDSMYMNLTATSNNPFYISFFYSCIVSSTRKKRIIIYNINREIIPVIIKRKIIKRRLFLEIRNCKNEIILSHPYLNFRIFFRKNEWKYY